jgi:hypothetical protein
MLPRKSEDLRGNMHFGPLGGGKDRHCTIAELPNAVLQERLPTTPYICSCKIPSMKAEIATGWGVPGIVAM